MFETKPNPPLLFLTQALRTRSAVAGALLLVCASGIILTIAVSAMIVGNSPSAQILAVIGYLIAISLAAGLMRRGFPHPTLGLCNAVTLLRLAMVMALLAPLASDRADGWTVFWVAAIALSLDGVDGWLARREGRVSEFGARLDMEVDSVLALILALNAWVSGAADVWVLLIGLPRYVFVVAPTIFPWLDAPLPEKFSRKVVCVVQIGALIALQPHVLDKTAANLIVLATACALIWSFGRDIRWLWQNRA